jgi:hypothetical protein
MHSLGCCHLNIWLVQFRVALQRGSDAFEGAFKMVGTIFSKLAFSAALLISSPVVSAVSGGAIPQDVAGGLKDMIALSRTHGENLWRGYGKTAFGFLLVQPDREVLLCDNRLPDGFVRAVDDPVLGCKQASGPPSWRQASFLAAMPVFGPPSVIVMGTPATTGRTPGDWKMTILHEHFHQWQSAQTGYYDRVAALDLAGGDETGMWMLNYAFPYADASVGNAHARASAALKAAILANKKDLVDATKRYLVARGELQKTVSERDWRYFEFQLWQEGVARWTEFTLGAKSKDEGVRAAAAVSREKTVEALAKPTLKADGRVAVYAFGSGEAMLLDRIDPHWRRCYSKDFALGPRFEKRCK